MKPSDVTSNKSIIEIDQNLNKEEEEFSEDWLEKAYKEIMFIPYGSFDPVFIDFGGFYYYICNPQIKEPTISRIIRHINKREKLDIKTDVKKYETAYEERQIAEKNIGTALYFDNVLLHSVIEQWHEIVAAHYRQLLKDIYARWIMFHKGAIIAKKENKRLLRKYMPGFEIYSVKRQIHKRLYYPRINIYFYRWRHHYVFDLHYRKVSRIHKMNVKRRTFYYLLHKFKRNETLRNNQNLISQMNSWKQKLIFQNWYENYLFKKNEERFYRKTIIKSTFMSWKSDKELFRQYHDQIKEFQKRKEIIIKFSYLNHIKARIIRINQRKLREIEEKKQDTIFKWGFLVQDLIQYYYCRVAMIQFKERLFFKRISQYFQYKNILIMSYCMDKWKTFTRTEKNGKILKQYHRIITIHRFLNKWRFKSRIVTDEKKIEMFQQNIISPILVKKYYKEWDRKTNWALYTKYEILNRFRKQKLTSKAFFVLQTYREYQLKKRFESYEKEKLRIMRKVFNELFYYVKEKKKKDRRKIRAFRAYSLKKRMFQNFKQLLPPETTFIQQPPTNSLKSHLREDDDIDLISSLLNNNNRPITEVFFY